MESMLKEGIHPDRDYWLNRAEVERLRALGADDSLLGMLEAALGEMTRPKSSGVSEYV